jgi:hypothetical protein
MRYGERVLSVGSGECVGKVGGVGVGYDYDVLNYKVCMLPHKWGRWGLLPVLQRVVLDCRRWDRGNLLLAS